MDLPFPDDDSLENLVGEVLQSDESPLSREVLKQDPSTPPDLSSTTFVPPKDSSPPPHYSTEETGEGEAMPRPTNEVRLLWRDAQPGVVHHRADLNGLQGKSNEGATVVNLATALEPHQELVGTPIVNVRQVAIDITNPTDAPQKLENIPLHELSDLHKRMQAQRAEMAEELIVPGKISG